MPNGTRNTAGINTTANQQRYRGRGLETGIPGSKTQQEHANDWLRRILSDGPKDGMLDSDVKQRAQREGVDELMLLKARTALGVESVRGDEGGWLWRLPEKPLEAEEQSAALTAAFAVDRTRPGEDEFSLTPDELKQFGIKDTEDYSWIRDPRQWEETRIAPGRVRQFKNENDGGRIVTFKGDYVTNGQDLILAARPRKLVEEAQARDMQREREYWGYLDAGQREDDFPAHDREALLAIRHANSRANIESGRIGPNSPSHGMNYEDYVRYRGLTTKDIEAEEMLHCFGHAVQDMDDEAASAAFRDNQQRRETRQGRDSGGKFISIPANVRPRNLMQPKGAAK